MRPRLLELPDAPLLATAAAIIVLLYTLWRAFILSGDGWKKTAPSIIGGLLIAGILIRVVAFGEGFQDAGVPIFSYGFMIMLGFAGVILISAMRGRMFGLDSNHIMDLGLFAMLGGIVGARLWHYFQYDLPNGTPGDPYPDFAAIFKIWHGGIVFYGGLVGGFICCTAYIVKHKLNYWVVSEACGPAIPIGIAFARLGCFLNGCCFGGVCTADSFAAVRFPANPGGDLTMRSPAYAQHLDGLRGQMDDVIASGNDTRIAELNGQIDALIDSGFSYWVHPAQLFASLGTMLICGLLFAYSRFFARKPGESFFMLLILYAPFRFWMETFRDDTPIVLGGMTAGQVAGIPLILVGAAGIAWLRLGKPPHMEGMTMKDGQLIGAHLSENEGPRPDAPKGLDVSPAPPSAE